MSNKDRLHNLRSQGLLLHSLRSWFFTRGYTEVHTPVAVPSAALEENLEAIRIADAPLFLHTSPEFAMKRRLADGLCRIYQIAHCFRGEEVGPHHAMEFRMLEWYRVGASWWDIANETINLISHLYEQVDLTPPKFDWIPTSELLSPNLAPKDWYFEWVDNIEPNLPTACIVYDYPNWQAALARTRHGVAERFEVYIEGIELANAFDEESSSEEIRKRWNQSNAFRITQQKPIHPIDDEFLQAIDRMPRCSGIALGIDRLMMLLLKQTSIHGLL